MFPTQILRKDTKFLTSPPPPPFHTQEQTTLTVLLETEILHEQDVKIQLHSERGIYTQADHLSLLNPYAVGVAIPGMAF